MTAKEAKAKADFRNSDEFQFKKIIDAIEKFASGEQRAQGDYEMKFKPLKPEMKERLVGLGYEVSDTTTPLKQIKEVEGVQTEEEVMVDVTLVKWGETPVKMEVVND